jgi:hypothetical protein
MLPPLLLMTTISLFILDFLKYIASTISCKFMSYTKMLYKLIRNSLTNSVFVHVWSIKVDIIWCVFFWSILCFNLKASLGLGILVTIIIPTLSFNLSYVNDVIHKSSVVMWTIWGILFWRALSTSSRKINIWSFLNSIFKKNIWRCLNCLQPHCHH